jgi:hypothetical protein
MQQEELGSEAGSEVVPIDEIRTSGISRNRLPMVYSVSPFLGSALIHVRHGPLYFYLFVRKIIWAKAEVSLAGIEEAFAIVAISVEIGRWGGLQIVFGLVTEVTGSGSCVVGIGLFWFWVMPASSRKVLFKASSIWAF